MSTELYLIAMCVFVAILGGGSYLIFSTRQSSPYHDPGRRSLFGFGERSDGQALFFGLQIAVRVFGSDTLRAQLASLILPEVDAAAVAEDGLSMDELPALENLSAKRKFLKSISSLLIENRYAWEYGFWDYQSDGEEAIAQFNQWRNEIESSFASSEAEIGSVSDPLHRATSGNEFLIVSVLMLIDNRNFVVEDDEGDYAFRPTYAGLAASFRELIENIPSSDLWTPQTFEHILEAIRSIDPRAIEREAVFLLPGNSDDGISELDLIGDEGWQYLTAHPIRAI